MDSSADDVGQLIRRAQRGDRTAFDALYRLTITPVYRYVAARVDTVDEAEELTQEVFLAALGGVGTLRAATEPALLAWLFQIARFKRADRLRERYRHPAAAIEEAEQVMAPQPGPDEVAVSASDQARVRSAMARLTDDQREVVICKYVLGYDNERTGQVIEKNANAVNQLHHRALAALHRLLSQPPTEPFAVPTGRRPR